MVSLADQGRTGSDFMVKLFLSLVLFSFLTLILGPGHISFIGSDSRDKVCFFDTSFRVSLVLGSGIKIFPGSGLDYRMCFFHWLWVQSQGAQ